MPTIYITDNAEKDLDLLYDKDIDEWAEIRVALEEISDSSYLMNHLSDQTYRNISEPSFESGPFYALYRAGKNIFRIKCWDYKGALLSHRIIYAHHPTEDKYYVLAIIDRSFNYDTSHPTVSRVCSDYERLGIPTY